MKRKSLFVMFAAVGMMLATSCSNDEQLVQSRDEAQVTFALGLENGINTRTISDGTGINQLHYAIFDSNNKIVLSSKAQNVTFPFNTSISLVKGEQYTAVFWAQNKECDAYTISDDMTTINVNYGDAPNNDESRDAFFRSETFTVTDDINLSIVLKRPFAQLNVGISTEEWNTAVAQGLTIATSEVEIKQAATTLNLIDGSVGNAQDITFEANAIPTETLYVDYDNDGDLDEFTYLSMCYFLANDEQGGAYGTTLDNLSFTFTAENGNSIVLNQGLANAPVQRNHRTNILSFGENGILTGSINVEVLLDPLYDGEHTLTNENVWEENAGIYTEEALAGMTIEIPAGWHIRNGYILEPMPENWTTNKPNGIDNTYVVYEKSYTIDGKNNTVTFEPYDYTLVAKNAFAATNGELVTIKNLTFAGEHFGVFGGVYGGNDFNTTFDNVTIENNGIYCYNTNGNIPMSAFSNLGTATLNNCTIKGTYWVGEKDLNMNAQNAYDNYGLYDVFVPNNKMTTINNSEIGSIILNNHGNLTVSGTSTVDQIVAKALVQGTITIQKDAKVASLYVNEYSTSYAPTVKIEAGAKVETLQLNSIAKTSKITIEEGANITTIIYKDVEYTSIQDFKDSLK